MQRAACRVFSCSSAASEQTGNGCEPREVDWGRVVPGTLLVRGEFGWLEIVQYVRMESQKEVRPCTSFPLSLPPLTLSALLVPSQLEGGRERERE